MKILILGSTGMLGSMVLDYLSKKGLDITTPFREELEYIRYADYDWIINCIGIIKQKLTDPRDAIRINALYPYMLSEEAPKAKIIQIATDCVFSGKKGHYTEDDEHDASDIYGKTKSLGEVMKPNFYNIRTSIVGIDKANISLLSWFLSQEKNATVKGYTNYHWNGITTLHFAKLCYALMKKKRSVPNNFHFFPKDVVNKYGLLNIFAEKFNRKDIRIEPFVAKDGIDRTLSTICKVNSSLWKDMGYDTPPTIEQMVGELAEYEK